MAIEGIGCVLGPYSEEQKDRVVHAAIGITFTGKHISSGGEWGVSTDVCDVFAHTACGQQFIMGSTVWKSSMLTIGMIKGDDPYADKPRCPVCFPDKER